MHSRDLETKYSPLLSQLTVIHPQSKRMNGARSLEILYPQLQAVASVIEPSVQLADTYTSF